MERSFVVLYLSACSSVRSWFWVAFTRHIRYHSCTSYHNTFVFRTNDFCLMFVSSFESFETTVPPISVTWEVCRFLIEIAVELGFQICKDLRLQRSQAHRYLAE